LCNTLVCFCDQLGLIVIIYKTLLQLLSQYSEIWRCFLASSISFRHCLVIGNLSALFVTTLCYQRRLFVTFVSATREEAPHCWVLTTSLDLQIPSRPGIRTLYPGWEGYRGVFLSHLNTKILLPQIVVAWMSTPSNIDTLHDQPWKHVKCQM
jgi:hypothetical protein